MDSGKAVKEKELLMTLTKEFVTELSEAFRRASHG